MKSLGSLFGRQNHLTSTKTPPQKKASGKPKSEPARAPESATDRDGMSEGPPRHDARDKAQKQPKSALKQALQTPHTADGAAKEHAPQGKTTVAEANRRWNTGPVPERTAQKVRFAENHQEHTITKGIGELKENFSNTRQNAKKLRLYEAAQKANLPVAAKDGTMMVWPSGQAYTGHFDKAGLPGPTGTVTLADGREFHSFWQNGKCYRLADATGHVTPAQIEKVASFKTVK